MPSPLKRGGHFSGPDNGEAAKSLLLHGDSPIACDAGLAQAAAVDLDAVLLLDQGCTAEHEGRALLFVMPRLADRVGGAAFNALLAARVPVEQAIAVDVIGPLGGVQGLADDQAAQSV